MVILPVIPLSASGVEDKTIVRGLFDLAAWSGTISKMMCELNREDLLQHGT